MIKRTDISEFKEFLKGDATPSAELGRRIVSTVRRQLNPSLPATVAKMFLFHGVGSFVTLTFCPQFGVSLTGFTQLMKYIMQVHPALCFFFCGVMWMVIGQALTYSLLTWDEQRVIGRTRWGFGLGVMVLTILVFGCLGKVSFDWWLAIWGLGGLGVVSAFNIRLDNKARRMAPLRIKPL